MTTGKIALSCCALAATVASLAAAPAGAARKLTCTTGHTLYSSPYNGGRARLFFIRVAKGRTHYSHFYFCGPRFKRPRYVTEDEVDASHTFSSMHRVGRRLVFLDYVDTDPAPGYVVGWLDLATGSQRLSWDYLSDPPAAMTVVPGGSVVIMTHLDFKDADPDWIDFIAPQGKRYLAAPRKIAAAPDGDPIVASSLAVTSTRVTWRTASGKIGTVPLP